MKFYAVDIKKKKIIWEYVDKEERWWLGLEDSFADAVLIHGYQNPKFPEHKGITALNPTNGNILWKNASWVYVNKSGPNLLVAAGVDDKFSIIDPKKGNILQEINSSELSEFTNIEPSKIVSGQPINQDHEVYLKIKTFIFNQLHVDVLDQLTYLEHIDHLLFSFYTADPEGRSSNAVSEDRTDVNNTLLIQMLWIIDKNGNQKTLKTLGKKLKGITSDPFFVFENMVIFLVEKNELVIYELE